MVRTLASGPVRVAVGGKAPSKKTTSNSRSPSPLGKDNFPVNKYFPRDTPAWQKKITLFIKSDKPEKSREPDKIIKLPKEDDKSTARRSKRSCSVLNVSNEIDTEEIQVTTKKFKGNDLAEDNSDKNVENANGSMEMDE